MRKYRLLLPILVIAILTLALAQSAISQTTVQLKAGDVSGSFTTIASLGSESEVTEIKIVTQNNTESVRKIPGRLNWLNVTLKRALTSDKKLADWRKMVETGDIQGARRNATLAILDANGTPLATWSLVACWPAAIKVELSEGILIEELVIVCEGIERTSS